MDVKIVDFPLTKVAAIEHFGPSSQEHATVRKLVEWKIENNLLDPQKYRNYGIHHTDPRSTHPSEQQITFCLSVIEDVKPNPYGISTMVMPPCRCAYTRDVGSRYNNLAGYYLVEKWLPTSGERLGEFPLFFHYVNVGPELREEDLITDIYLPLK